MRGCLALAGCVLAQGVVVLFTCASWPNVRLRVVLSEAFELEASRCLSEQIVACGAKRRRLRIVLLLVAIALLLEARVQLAAIGSW